MGRISLLVSRDLQVIVTVARGLPAEVSKQLRAQTRRVVEPAFLEEMRSRGTTRIEQRALVGTARVAVRDDNVILKSAQVGKIGRAGVPAAVIAGAAEFGGNPNRKVEQRSRGGKRYTRRMGPVFRAPRRKGYVFFPSVQAFIPRAGALWFQTAVRTVREQFDKVQ